MYLRRTLFDRAQAAAMRNSDRRSSCSHYRWPRQEAFRRMRQDLQANLEHRPAAASWDTVGQTDRRPAGPTHRDCRRSGRGGAGEWGAPVPAGHAAGAGRGQPPERGGGTAAGASPETRLHLFRALTDHDRRSNQRRQRSDKIILCRRAPRERRWSVNRCGKFTGRSRRPLRGRGSRSRLRGVARRRCPSRGARSLEGRGGEGARRGRRTCVYGDLGAFRSGRSPPRSILRYSSLRSTERRVTERGIGEWYWGRCSALCYSTINFCYCYLFLLLEEKQLK